MLCNMPRVEKRERRMRSEKHRWVNSWTETKKQKTFLIIPSVSYWFLVSFKRLLLESFDWLSVLQILVFCCIWNCHQDLNFCKYVSPQNLFCFSKFFKARLYLIDIFKLSLHRKVNQQCLSTFSAYFLYLPSFIWKLFSIVREKRKINFNDLLLELFLFFHFLSRFRPLFMYSEKKRSIKGAN